MKKIVTNSRFASDNLAQVEQELLLNQVIENIELKKLSIILQRIKERFDIDFDLEQESKNRFKKLQKEISIDHEHIYFDDGSEQGHLLVSFEYSQTEPTFDNEMVKAFYGFNYK